jgi:hypothetical protein
MWSMKLDRIRILKTQVLTTAFRLGQSEHFIGSFCPMRLHRHFQAGH